MSGESSGKEIRQTPWGKMYETLNRKKAADLAFYWISEALQMNYNEIARMATEGINFFSDGNGEFKCITQRGSVEIIGGEEVEKPEISVMIKGLIRSPKFREVDGETIRVTDKLGVLTTSLKLRTGIILMLMVNYML
ncbi:UNVERIFIED_ASMBLY: ribonucleoside-triphosphate reductase [Shigella phage 2019SD1]|uniref:Ribonucleoside-triphosphate reductase n=1 Tax=Shigella phage 2019SD1 TaxID=2848074 RepID=A0A6M5CDM5_9CAUD|nr:ribonucleoside-triphosphate reductase [Shigella phage 2019SD1]